MIPETPTFYVDCGANKQLLIRLMRQMYPVLQRQLPFFARGSQQCFKDTSVEESSAHSKDDSFLPIDVIQELQDLSQFLLVIKGTARDNHVQTAPSSLPLPWIPSFSYRRISIWGMPVWLLSKPIETQTICGFTSDIDDIFRVY